MKKNDLVKKIKETAPQYGSIPFWSWNDRLQKEELLRQIHNMKEMEMGGFFMHARGGLETPYMGEEWFDCIKECVEEAKKLKMEAWAYDENGWPSGFAGGEVLKNPDNHALYIKGEFSEDFPQGDENTLAIFALQGREKPIHCQEPIEGAEQYLMIQRGADSSYVDTMRADITDQFIRATHEEYKARLGEDFGSAAMPGFFTDEPQYYRWRTPYSAKMEEWFQEEYGYSALDALPALFYDYEGAKEHRYDYHRITSIKFRENFAKRIYDWAEENGARITGHFIEESSLSGQMLCCGGIMPLYQYEHIPGIDYLGRSLRPSDMAQKQLGSVCAQIGREKALSEMFACCGWDVSPRELKNIAEFQYAGGVNLMCQHLYPYSIRGQRKRDYPAFYSEHNLWQKALLPFNRFFNHLGAILSMGEEGAETLVIHPIRSAWLTYQRANNGELTKELNQDFVDLLCSLSDLQLPYHLGDETMMAELASVQKGTLHLGKCRYRQVILPACDTLDSSTVALLKEFMAAGGKVYTYLHHLPTRIDGRKADLSFLAHCEDLTDEDGFERLFEEESICITLPKDTPKKAVRSMVRRTEFGRLIYLTNLSKEEVCGIQIIARNCAALGRMDIGSLETAPLFGKTKGKDAVAELDLLADESVILFEQNAPAFLKGRPAKREYLQFKNPFTIKKLPLNMLMLDRARVSYDGKNFSEPRPMEQIRDNLLSSRYKGELTLSFPFYIKDLPEILELELEPFGGKGIVINGQKIPIGDRAPRLDRSFLATDIAPFIKEGENTIDLTMDYWQREEVYYVLYGGVSETLRNCLVFDSEIENVYLFGSFALDAKAEDFEQYPDMALRYQKDEPMALIKQKETIDIHNIVCDGYPFFCGEIAFATTLDHKAGDPTLLHLTGRYSTARIEVNGKEAANLIMSEYADLGEYLKEGENQITLTLCNNYRNLLGPHHAFAAEQVPVDPRAFSFENKWKGDCCPDYEPHYSFMRFGID